MPGKPPRVPSGFLTKNGVAAWARARGIHINPKTLSMMANKGKIPHARLIPGRKRGRMFPDDPKKLEQVVAACPKRTITAEQTFSTQQALKLAQEKKLPLCLADIQNKLNQIQAGKRPCPAGLKRDEFDPRKRWILPKSFVDSLLADAEARKRLPQMLQEGSLVPLSKLATNLGLSERSLNPRRDISKVRIAGRLFVSKDEALRVTNEYENKKKFAPAKKKAARPAVLSRMKGESFEKWVYRVIEMLRLPSIAEQDKVGIRKKLGEKIKSREQGLTEARKKLLDKRAHGKVTMHSLIEENNLEIARIRLEIFGCLLEGMKETDRAVMKLISRINDLQSYNRVMRGK